MRLLLDENFPKVAVDVLSKEGHDVLWIRMYAPGMKDREILKLAAQQERIVLTLDKDFRQLSATTRVTVPSGSIFRRISDRLGH